MESMGDRIKRLREKKGMTQKELAAAANITEASLSRYENNLRDPRPEILARLARALDTTTDYLISAYIPDTYSDGKPISRRDISQYDAFIQNASAFFMNDEVADEDKEALFRDISELFWKSKEKNREKYRKAKNRKSNK